jgi:hypothetical protein
MNTGQPLLVRLLAEMFDVEAIAWLKDLPEKRNKAQNAIGSARDDAADRRIQPGCLVDRGRSGDGPGSPGSAIMSVGEDAFAAIIRSTADPAKADKRTRSRVAARNVW